MSIIRHGLSMRSTYVPPPLSVGGWFPRHMAKGLMQMQGKMHNVDGIIEVHDARIPFTGRNSRLSDIGILKPSILVLNKIDLIDKDKFERIKRRFGRDDSSDVIFSNCKVSKNEAIKSIVPLMVKKIKESDRFNRTESANLNLMVVGIPNVGKSSLINALRNINMHRSSSAAVAPRPGVTTNVMERVQISWNPPVYVRDTPGVLSPRIPGVQAGLRLALSHCVLESLVETEHMADYLLFWLNKRGRHEYVSALQLPQPTDDIRKLLVNVAVRNNMTFKRRDNRVWREYPDLMNAAEMFITQWRKGAFGCAFLDDDDGFW